MNQIMKKSIDRVLNDYRMADNDIFEYLSRNNFRDNDDQKTLTISQSIDRIIAYALKNADRVADIPSLKSLDTLVFGDVHGQLDLFVQNLYFAGVIDKNGVLRQDCDKKIIQLGDVVDRGPYSIETIVYMRMLQKQSEALGRSGPDLKFLVGNHEIYHVDLYFSFDNNPYGTNYVNHWNFKKDPEAYKTLRKMIFHDIDYGKIKLTYADKNTNIFYSHAGLEKEILVKTLIEMLDYSKYKNKLQTIFNGDIITNTNKLKDILSIIQKKRELKKKYFDIAEYSYNQSNYIKKSVVINEDDKVLIGRELNAMRAKTSDQVSTQNIYKIAQKLGISVKEISNHMNKVFLSYLRNRYLKNIPLKPHFLLSVDSLLVSRKKATNQMREETKIVNYIPTPEMTKYRHKPILISGHEVTDNIYGGINGAIKQNRANVFIDVGLNFIHGARQAFLGIDKEHQKLIAYEHKDIKSNKMLSGLEIGYVKTNEGKHRAKILRFIDIDKKKLFERQLQGIYPKNRDFIQPHFCLEK